MIEENEILSQTQKEFLREFGRSSLSTSFVLSGGTALAAFHFRHRLSDDLDLFSFEPVDGAAVRAFLAMLPFVATSTEQHIFDRNVFLLTLKNGATLKVEFTRYPFKHLEPPLLIDGVRVDSLRDIAANKVAAFVDRVEPKDSVDLYMFVVRGFALDRVAADAERKFGTGGLRHTLEARLLAVRADAGWPQLRVPFVANDLVERFREEARGLVRRTLDET